MGSIIGILGLDCAKFNELFRIGGFGKRNNREYTNGVDTFILIDNYAYLDGRHFDRIIDLDPLRMEARKRIGPDGIYRIGDISTILF